MTRPYVLVAEDDRELLGVLLRGLAEEELNVAGVTTGALLRGVRYTKDGAITDSIVMRSRSGTVRRIEARHSLRKLEQLSGGRYG